ncbi:MAG: hypothetical protein QOJ96_1357 [Alphaproteobacteria bacterium]|nr:hypothetical protein [Alphaproteobacteria bacterium]
MAKRPASQKRQKADKGKKADDFLSVARRLECDEDKGRFEAELKRIAKPTVATK